MYGDVHLGSAFGVECRWQLLTPLRTCLCLWSDWHFHTFATLIKH